MNSNKTFWKGWKDRLRENNEVYITPQDQKVIDAVERIGINGSDTQRERAIKVWNYVYNNVTYKLSREWKTPRQTLVEGVGDCEDVTFLIASMLPNVGVDQSTIELGILSNKGELHTWNEVNGMIVDGTGTQKTVQYHDYIKQTKGFTIKAYGRSN